MKLARMLDFLAWTAYSAERLAEAEAASREAAEICGWLPGRDDPEYAWVLNKRATILIDQQDFPGTEELLREVLAVEARHLGADHPQYAGHLANLASTLLGN